MKTWKRSGLYFLHKGRRHGVEITSSRELINAIQKQGYTSTGLMPGGTNDGTDLNLKRIEVQIALV